MFVIKKIKQFFGKRKAPQNDTTIINTNSNSKDTSCLDVLLEMGFDCDQSTQAMQRCKGDVQASLSYLLSQQQSTKKLKTSNTAILHGTVSQYSVNGRSACTCMALCGAKIMLSQTNITNVIDNINAEFLQNIVLKGKEIYDSSINITNGVEHTSVEEILSSNAFPTLKYREIIQGVMTSHKESNLRTQLLECMTEFSWTFVVMTKTPETILLCLSQDLYIIVDTHPRPHLNAEYAYAQILYSIDELVAAIELLFPAVDLGPDVSKIMAAMYNSYDLYIIEKRDKAWS